MTTETYNKIHDYAKSAGILRDLGFIGTLHRDGLVDGIRVEVPSGYCDGTLAVAMVTPDSVQKFILQAPYNYRNWQAVSSPVFYKTPEEMVGIVRAMQEPKRGCW